MKIAVFHNYLDNIGGAEIVGLTLARELNAHVFTTNIDAEKIKKMGFADVLPRVFSIGKIPINAPWRQQIALLKFRNLNLKNKYDFYIIDGDWAISGAVNHHPNMWYVHSPIREIWDLKDYVKNNLLSGWHEKIIFEAWAQFNRKLNKKYAGKVDCFVCNSKNTQERLKNFLGKDSIVINPPVDTSKFYWAEPKNYWLSVNRLYWHKRIDLQIKAFTKMPKEKLVIVGCYEKSKHFGEYANYIKKIKPKNVKILSWVSQKKLGEFYANCKGVLATAINEDFGMSAVEAMASGKPVIAAAEGGYKETIIHGKTGILIDQINEEKLIEAVKKIGGNTAKFKKACFAQAQNFDTEIFIEKVTKVINENRNNSYNSQL